MITEQDNLCYCILTLQYIKRHYVAGYLLVNLYSIDIDDELVVEHTGYRNMVIYVGCKMRKKYHENSFVINANNLSTRSGEVNSVKTFKRTRRTYHLFYCSLYE